MSSRKKYSAEQKVKIVREYLVNRVPVSQLAARYGINPSMIHKWQKQLFEWTVKTFETKHGPQPVPTAVQKAKEQKPAEANDLNQYVHSTEPETRESIFSTTIPMPRRKKLFTQLDRISCPEQTFEQILPYLNTALAQLESKYSEIQTQLQQIHSQKFVIRIYDSGEIVIRAKIWIGGFGQMDSIRFDEGFSIFEDDNTYSELLSVEDDEQKLVFRCLLGDTGHKEPNGQAIPTDRVGEYFRRRLITPVERQ